MQILPTFTLEQTASWPCGLSATRAEVSVTQILVSFASFLLGKVRCQQGPEAKTPPPPPQNHKCKEKGKQVTDHLCAGSFSGVADHYILRLFYFFIFFFSERKLKDKHLKEKLISVSRWQEAISPQGACQGSTDVRVRTITWFKESGEKGRGGGEKTKKNQTTKIKIILARQLIFFSKAVYSSKERSIKMHPYGNEMVKWEFALLDFDSVNLLGPLEGQFGNKIEES